MTVSRLLSEADSRELSEWMAEDQLSPIDHAERAELSAGIVAATVANANRSKNQDPFSPADFIKDWGEEVREAADAAKEVVAMTPAQVREAMARFRGRHVRSQFD